MTPGKNFAIAFTIIGVLASLLQAGFVLTEDKQIKTTSANSLQRKRLLQAQLSEALTRDFLVFAGDQNQTFEIHPEILRSWITSSFRNYLGATEYRIDKERVKKYLVELPVSFGTSPTDGKLATTSNGALHESEPSRTGKILNLEKSADNLITALEKGNSWAEFVFDDITAKVSLRRARELGITSLLGEGKTNFAGSPSARTQNIKIGAAIFNGLTLDPGEEFSFNNILGPVDESGGYKPELVLKDHQIMPEYGGGLCQVSTTIFRAATNAGLRITERHNHSLALRYYSPQGFDAAIYPGVSDLKFVNDTSHTILIQSNINGTNISFQIFGVNDGRNVQIDGPHTYENGQGTAIKTIMTRTVTFNDGSQKKDIFYSDYKDAALYPMVKNPLE